MEYELVRRNEVLFDTPFGAYMKHVPSSIW